MQALYRYTYVRNNPLKYVDPNGHLFFAAFRSDFYLNPDNGPRPVERSGVYYDRHSGANLGEKGLVSPAIQADDVILAAVSIGSATILKKILTKEGVNLVEKQVAKDVAEEIAAKSGTTALVPKGAASLGKWGKTRLARVLGGAGTKPAKPFSTSLGNRYIDRLVNGIAHEAKAGLNVKLNSTIEKQILKDAELIAKGRIRGAHWHFFQGADKSVLNALSEHSIKYTIHPTH